MDTTILQLQQITKSFDGTDVLRGISLRPALDPSGAGGRGLAQSIGSSGAIGLILTGDRKLTEVVVLK